MADGGHTMPFFVFYYDAMPTRCAAPHTYAGDIWLLTNECQFSVRSLLNVLCFDLLTRTLSFARSLSPIRTYARTPPRHQAAPNKAATVYRARTAIATEQSTIYNCVCVRVCVFAAVVIADASQPFRFHRIELKFSLQENATLNGSKCEVYLLKIRRK